MALLRVGVGGPIWYQAELPHTFGISGTDIVENSFSWLREKARRDKAEKQAPITLMEACDKRHLQLSAESDTLAPKTVSPDIFKASNCKCRLGEEIISRFLEHCEGDAWPHPSPQASLLIPEAWYLPRSFRGHWGNLQQAWRSLLAMLGWVLYHRTDKIGYFVLQSSRYSCLTWRSCIHSHGSVYFIRLGNVDDATAEQLRLTALDEGSDDSSAADACSGGEALWGRRIAWHHARVHAWRREQAAVAETAFKALTGFLWDDVCRDTDARKRTSEFDLCFQLVKKSCHTIVT